MDMKVNLTRIEPFRLDLEVGQKAVMKRVFTQSDYDRFARLSRDDNPTHVDPEFCKSMRFSKTLAHGMQLYSNICRMLSTLTPGPGMLQTGIEMMFPGPVFTGDEVTCELELLALQGMQARFRTTIHLPYAEPFNRGLAGETVVYLPGWTGGFPGIDASMIPQYRSEGDALGPIRLGDEAAAVRTFTREDLEEYASLTGDHNPLMLDSAWAKKAGFRDCIVPGPLLSGMFSYLLGTELPGRGTNWMKQKLHFPNPAYVGEEITATVKVVRIRPDKKIINLYDTCVTKEGKVVCQAESTTLALEML